MDFSVEESKEIWNENAAFWDGAMGDESNDFHRDVVRPRVTELLEPAPGDYVLDAACGNGNYSAFLAEQGVSVVAFDYSERMIELARARQARWSQRIEFCVADATDRASLLALRRDRPFTKAVSNMAVMDIADILRGEMDNTPDDVLRAYADGIAENLDWLASLPLYNEDEVTISDFYEVGSGSSCYPEYNELEHAYSISRIRWNTDNENGLTQVTSFMNAVKNTYSDVITHKTSAPVTALVQDPATKEILGCVYTENGASVYVKANKGVIMCCGGFEANAQMKADYLSAPRARRIAGRCNEGDGITMCARCGADMWHMNSCAGFWTSMSAIDSDTCLMRTPKDQGITVGVNGRRFYMDWDTDVSLDWDTFTERDLRMHAGSRHGHMQFGGEWPHLPMPAVTWLIVGTAGYQSILENKMMNITWDPMDGWGYSADTLEGLAETIGVPAEELVRSVEQWDECCTNGEDVYFHRPASTLNPIGDGPYYALYCPPTMLNTDGGPRRSAKGEILDLDGQPIPHLYSAGEFGSIWANMYQGAGNLGECLAFGRISARNCLGIA